MRGSNRFVVGAAVLAMLAWSGGVVFSQDKGENKGEKQAAPGADPQAEMMKLLQPGEHHKHLAAAAGEWEVTGKMWEVPGQPPKDMKGTAKNHLVLGGRFLVEEFDGGSWNGMPFLGYGIFGYDNMKKLHTSVWMDSMGTQMMATEGTCEGEGCRKVTLAGSWTDPAGKWGWKSITTHEDAKMHMEAFITSSEEALKMMPPGTPREWKAMEMDYTRKK